MDNSSTVPMDYTSVIGLDKVSMSPSFGSVIPLRDGQLLWMWGHNGVHAITSQDGGRTWGKPRDAMLVTGDPVLGVQMTNLLRLSSGDLGLVVVSEEIKGVYSAARRTQIAFHRSDDEGESWSSAVTVNPPNVSACVSGDKCIVLSDGRIIVPVDQYLGPVPTSDDPKGVERMGQRFGNLERNALVYSFTLYSDDEGQTWQRSENEVMAQIEKGFGGSYSFIEPAVVELNDGRLMMLGRTNLGSLYSSYSENRGVTWQAAEPTDLALSPSPCCIRRIPQTSDLLIIWNQASRMEMIDGVYRHRLTCAISKDEGLTWQHHRNLESLDDETYMKPIVDKPVLMGVAIRQPLDRTRYHRAPGPLRCNEPSCTFSGDTAIITYSQLVLGDKSIITDTYGLDFHEVGLQHGFTERPERPGRHLGNNKVRVLSIDWFYQE